MSDDALVPIPSARRLQVRWGAPGAIAGTARFGLAAASGREALEVRVLGRPSRGGELEALLGTHAASDAELVRAVNERFGWGGFLRLFGPFAAAIAGDELVLLRSATFGREPAIFFQQGDDSLVFSTELSALAGPGARRLNARAVRTWLEHGVWTPRPTTPFEGITALDPGAALTLSRGGHRIDRFWTFTPFGTPRLLPEVEAQAEVEAAVGAALARAPEGAELSGEALARVLVERASPSLHPIDHLRDYGEPALREAYRRIAWPVALSDAAEVAALIGSDRPLVTDLGMRQVMGATETALGAYVESLSAMFGSSPGPSALVGVLRAGVPIDRRLVRSRLAPSLIEGARRAGARWKRHLPPALASRIDLESGEPVVDPVTGDAYVDRRFAETLDPGLAARHRAIASAREVVAPFLDPGVVELLFSLPRPHFVHEGRIMRAVGGGIPMAPVPRPRLPRYPDDHAFRERPRRWFSALERHADEDRWLGLGAFLSAWEVE